MNRYFIPSIRTYCSINKTPRSWKSLDEQRAFLISAQKTLGLSSITELATMNTRDLRNIGGRQLLKKYPSIPSMLQILFPDEKWDFKKRKKESGYWDSVKNQQYELSLVKDTFGIESTSDWISISSARIRRSSLRSILDKYSSFPQAIRTIYPSIQWDNPSNLSKMDISYWKDLDIQLDFLSKVKENYNLSHWEDITAEHIHSAGGSSLLSLYSSVPEILVKHGKLNSENSNNLILNALSKRDNISPSDLHTWCLLPIDETNEYLEKQGLEKLTSQNIQSLFSTLQKENPEVIDLHKKDSNLHKEIAVQILNSIKKSPYLIRPKHITSYLGGNIILGCYPKYSELVERFKDDIKVSKTRKNWQDIDTQRNFIEKLANKKNLKIPEELDKLSFVDIVSDGGRQLLRKYSSLFEMYKTLYPEYTWNIIDFSKTPRNTWDNIDNQKEFFTNLMKKLDLQSPLELSQINTTTVRSLGGRTILEKYSSYYELLRTLYPDENWSSVHQRAPRNHWTDFENIKIFVEKLKEKYNIQNKQDWYRLSYAQITETGGDRLLRLYGSFGEILKLVYPEEKWNMKKFRKKDKRSAQWWLFQQISSLYPNEEVIEEYNHEEMTRESGQIVQFDIFIPSLNIAFEYQGIHHYKDTAVFGPIELYKTRDIEKKELCEKYNIKLIIIPYWWDNTLESLKRDYIQDLIKE